MLGAVWRVGIGIRRERVEIALNYLIFKLQGANVTGDAGGTFTRSYYTLWIGV